ncbi:YdeI/OmpD-associated family protein [Myxococcus landrumensis]|uniref:YdeI/OmpD-associated family protein n=1 Tax=Myxococcus landrumensis TaxID=2813577 RepID=A0ABX7N5H1_9BACT|nr:YdeI/OmpD-associated family protein [Myxococcus landrumus]QSQ13991.1 YdeI/OmpD-associated family protein [Myxococcus landrumus]
MARAERRSVEAAPTRTFRGAAEFEAWLDAHGGAPAGVWLKLAKKGTGIASLTDDEAVDVGLCFGWISGQRKSLDERFYLQKYVPRRPRSRWSCVNVRKVEVLLAQGRMRPSGLAEVEAAQADGRWAAAYESQRNATVPDDLSAVLAANPGAARAFEALGRTRRYALILDVVTARTEAGRANHLRRVVESLESATASEGRRPKRAARAG